jgi:cytochrome P450
MASEVIYNPFDPSFLADPYPHYAPLLAGPPRRLAIGLPVVMVARYAGVSVVLRDHAHFASTIPRQMVAAGLRSFRRRAHDAVF